MIFGGLFGEPRRQFVLNVGPAFGHARTEGAEAVVITRRLDRGRQAVVVVISVAVVVIIISAAGSGAAALEHRVEFRFVLRMFVVLFALFEFGDMFDVLGHDRHEIHFTVGPLNVNHAGHFFQ